jgi:hypothetical protein
MFLLYLSHTDYELYKQHTVVIDSNARHIWITALEHVICLLSEESSAKYEIICPKSSKK